MSSIKQFWNLGLWRSLRLKFLIVHPTAACLGEIAAEEDVSEIGAAMEVANRVAKARSLNCMVAGVVKLSECVL